MSDLNEYAFDVRSISTTPSDWYDGIKTPTSTDLGIPTPAENVSSMPCPGKTYMIRLRNTDKVITLTEGKVLLQSTATPGLGCGWHWACVEKGNWLGFRNHVSGNLLGHNGHIEHYESAHLAGIHATQAGQTACESFCIRPHTHGGYVLLVRNARNDYLQQVGCASDGKRLVPKEKDGAQWTFEEVYVSSRS